jgi:hypothetical protein
VDRLGLTRRANDLPSYLIKPAPSVPPRCASLGHQQTPNEYAKPQSFRSFRSLQSIAKPINLSARRTAMPARATVSIDQVRLAAAELT